MIETMRVKPARIRCIDEDLEEVAEKRLINREEQELEMQFKRNDAQNDDDRGLHSRVGSRLHSNISRNQSPLNSRLGSKVSDS